MNMDCFGLVLSSESENVRGAVYVIRETLREMRKKQQAVSRDGATSNIIWQRTKCMLLTSAHGGLLLCLLIVDCLARNKGVIVDQVHDWVLCVACMLTSP